MNSVIITLLEDASRIGMGLLLAVATPIGGDGQMWAQWGLAGLLVGYTQWRDWRREEQMRLERVADTTWVRETMLPVLQAATKAIESGNEIHKGNAAVLERINQKLFAPGL